MIGNGTCSSVVVATGGTSLTCSMPPGIGASLLVTAFDGANLDYSSVYFSYDGASPPPSLHFRHFMYFHTELGTNTNISYSTKHNKYRANIWTYTRWNYAPNIRIQFWTCDNQVQTRNSNPKFILILLFSMNRTVYIGSQQCLNITWISDSQVSCSTPSGTGINIVSVDAADQSSIDFNIDPVFAYNCMIFVSNTTTWQMFIFYYSPICYQYIPIFWSDSRRLLRNSGWR